jgi:hypothetical protein
MEWWVSTARADAGYAPDGEVQWRWEGHDDLAHAHERIPGNPE